jgi:hypothetical protein
MIIVMKSEGVYFCMRHFFKLVDYVRMYGYLCEEPGDYSHDNNTARGAQREASRELLL